MERNSHINRLTDFLYRKIGSNSLSLFAILFYSLIAGIAGALVDIDHILLIAYVQIQGHLPPSAEWWWARPLHLLLLVVAVYLSWRSYSCIGRLLTKSFLNGGCG